MPGTCGDCDAVIGGGKFAPDPFLVFQAESGLGSDFLREEPIRGGRRDTSRRSVRLVEKSAVLQIRHDVADCRCAQRFFEAFGNRARRDRLACLDIRTDKVSQYLAVAPFLERCVSHSSTPVWRVLTTIVGTLSSPGQSLATLGSRSKLTTTPFINPINPRCRSVRAAICLSSRCTAFSIRCKSRL